MTSGSSSGVSPDTRRRTATMVVAGIAVAGCGLLVTSVTAAPALASAGASVSRVQSVAVSLSPTPYPGPGMMMGGAAGQGWMDDHGAWHRGMMTRVQARSTALNWVTDHYAGTTTSRGARVDHGYMFTITRHGNRLGALTVNTSNGRCSWTRHR